MRENFTHWAVCLILTGSIHWLFLVFALGIANAKDESEIRLTVAAILLESRVRTRMKTKNTNEL
jgi:hypothetical protein